MKKIYGFAALCAAMTLASCSNNDEPIAPVATGNGQLVTAGYLSINIANTGKTRGHSDFQYGTEAESKAKTATFLFFDASGKQIGKAENQALTSTTAHTSTSPVENIERDYEVMVPVQIELTADELKEDEATQTALKKQYVGDIERVVCILNPTHAADPTAAGADKTIDAMVAGKTETEVLAIAADYSQLVGDNQFVMTNSVYYQLEDAAAGLEAKIVYGQDVKGKIMPSPLEATQNPVDIYVERVVARVDVNNPETGMNIPEQELTVYGYDDNANGKFQAMDKKIQVVVKGIEVANLANQSYLVKNLKSTWTPDAGRFDDWNAPGYKRSHWAYTWSDGAGVKAPSRFVEEAKQGDITETWFKNKSWNNYGDLPENGKGKKYYINENTNEDYATALVISAELNEVKEDGSLAPLTLFRTEKDAKYYTEDGARNTLLDMLYREGYNIATEFTEVVVDANTGETKLKPTAFKSLTKSDIDFASAIAIERTDAKGYDGYLHFQKTKYDISVKDKDGNTKTKEYTPEELIYQTTDGGVTYTLVNGFEANVLQTKNYKVWKWDQGLCYYFINLSNQVTEQKKNEAGEAQVDEDGDSVMVNINGVVRNHIYQVDLKSVKGFGVPVFDPTEVIVPVTPPKLTPKDEWSIACNIHILSWAVYAQSGEFETDY